VLGFNYTSTDIKKSRSFGVVTKKRELVHEALKLFDADLQRQSYTPGLATFLVSPLNARERLAHFLKSAKKQLLVYDPKLTDPLMIRILQERQRAGVDVRIIGRMAKRGAGLTSEKYPGKRLHVRAIIQDGRRAFVGSQSLRKLELDSRREVGVIVKDPSIVSRLGEIFEQDWARTPQGKHYKKGH
jgi:phosphatidylserine/phosphatidylglycerophosphate/cardiolipin synthase-like enzyme